MGLGDKDSGTGGPLGGIGERATAVKELPWHQQRCNDCVFCQCDACRRNPPTVLAGNLAKYPKVLYRGGVYYSACSKFAKR